MNTIKHNLMIKVLPAVVYQAITTQQGLAAWWAKETTAKEELGYTNIFVFGTSRNEMKITALDQHKKVEWKCIQSISEWIHTTITFELEEKDGRTLLRFSHSGWQSMNDTFADCNYAWGRFMSSLKSYCESGTGSPS